jgi:hypothetical protein
MPDTVNGECLPWKVNTPFPAPTPTINPPLVKTTLTVPVSARVVVARPIDISRTTAATGITFTRDFLIANSSI